MNGFFVGFSKGFERSIEFEVTNLLRLEENELIIKVYSINEEIENNDVRLDPILDKISKSIIYSIPNLHVYDFYVALENKQYLNKSTIIIDCLLNGYSDSAIIDIYIYTTKTEILFLRRISITLIK